MTCFIHLYHFCLYADSQEMQKIFSPQQFILDQNNDNDNNDHTHTENANHHHHIDEDGKELNDDAIKPAISFQQQQFQNGGTLTVTNSHVTVTILYLATFVFYFIYFSVKCGDKSLVNNQNVFSLLAESLDTTKGSPN